MPKLTDEQAFEMVEKFVRGKGYKGEVQGLDIERRGTDGSYIDVMLLKPYGLFIVKPDLSIEDNYQVFDK